MLSSNNRISTFNKKKIDAAWYWTLSLLLLLLFTGKKITLKGMKLHWPWIIHEEDSERRHRTISPYLLPRERAERQPGGRTALGQRQMCTGTVDCQWLHPSRASVPGLWCIWKMPREPNQSGAPQSSSSLAAKFPSCQIPKLLTQRRLHNNLPRKFQHLDLV